MGGIGGAVLGVGQLVDRLSLELVKMDIKNQ